MNPNIPHNYNESARTTQSALYLPKYRNSVKNPSYALDVPQEIQRHQEVDNVFKHLEAIEEWRQREEASSRETKAIRWRAEKCGSLTLCILSGQKPQWNRLIIQASQLWEASSVGMIRFTHTVRPEEADILVDWTDEPVLGREFEVGHTNRQIQGLNWISFVRMTLLHSPEIDKHLDTQGIMDRVLATALHELGHALGLEHSKHPRDVMHHRGWRNTQLSRNDIESLHQLYSQTRTTRLWL